MSAAPGGSAPADARLRSMPHLDRRQRFHGATTANRTWYGAVVVNCIARRQPMHPRSPARETTLRDWLLIEEVRFAADSPLEGTGFEPSVPLDRDREASFSRVGDQALAKARSATSAVGSGRRSYHQQPWLSSLSAVPQAVRGMRGDVRFS